MDRPPENRTLRDFLRVLRAQWWIIVLATVTAGGAAFAVSLSQDSKYEATSRIALTADFFPQGLNQPALVSTAAIGLAASDRVYRETSAALGGSPSPAQLRNDVTTTFEPGSTVGVIKAEAATPAAAARIANEFAVAAKSVGRDITRATYRRQARIQKNAALKRSARTVDPVQIVQSAQVPASPVSPKPLRDTFLAACLGFLIGFGLAFLRQSLDRRVKTAADVRRAVDLPLVGYVRTKSLGFAGVSGNGKGPASSDDLDPFRILRANVDYLGRERAIDVLAITSPLPQEGKSSVSSGLAYASALAGRRTVLVECDLRRPVLGDRFSVAAAPGLSDYLRDDASGEDIVRSVEFEGFPEPLSLIPAGGEVHQPAELLASPQFGRLFTTIAKTHDAVILDCPPVLPVGDTLELLPRVDGVILCVRLGQTTYEQARAASEAIGHLPPKPTGLVITGLGGRSDEDYYGYYSAHGQAAID